MDLPTEDLAGTWDVTGRTRTLTAPSPEWEAERDAQPEPEPSPEEVARAALIQVAQLISPADFGKAARLAVPLVEHAADLASAASGTADPAAAEGLQILADAADAAAT